jgi:hypothetical protein
MPITSARCCSYKNGIDYHIATDKNVVMLSEGFGQEHLFEQMKPIIDEVNDGLAGEEKDKVKLWCEGHLPIRQIRVGNTRRREELRDKIKHFCQHSEYYWLRFVDVVHTDIPFRSPLKFK